MKLIWLPYNKKAAFTITDDTDKASFKTVTRVYDLMAEYGIRTTKTVWPFKPVELSGIPVQPDYWSNGITLQDKDYLEYCRWLSNEGFEICLHGASCGNNIRERTIDGFHMMEEIGFSTKVYICHSKNAENPYWENKIHSSRILGKLLSFYSKYETSGEITESKYFWGDICKEKVRYIRLFRTRELNTLKINPSMPYHNFNTPCVNYWFSATKRSLIDSTSEKALDYLVADNGVTILYQYMHRYADVKTGEISSKFIDSLRRLANRNDIWIDNVSKVLDRLKAFQLLFIVKNKDKFYVVNTSEKDICDVQMAFDRKNILKNLNNISMLSRYGSIPLLEGNSVLPIELLYRERIQHSNTKEICPDILLLEKPFAIVLINISNNYRNLNKSIIEKYDIGKHKDDFREITISPLSSITIYKNKDAKRLEVLDYVNRNEIARMNVSQIQIFLRENIYSKSALYQKIIKSRENYAYHDNW